MVLIGQMKICSKCGEEKEESAFYARASSSDGLRSQCKQCVKEYQNSISDKKSEYDANYYQNNREQKLEQSIIYGQEHKEEKQIYDQNRLPTILLQRKERYNSDLNYKLVCNLRSRLYVALKRNKKGWHTMELLACSIEELKVHIENKFIDGMSWDKIMSGEIHIDHIIPCASFDFSKEEDQKKCFHYTNLQPLWAEDNRKKYKKVL